MTIDEVFTARGAIASSVLSGLSGVMASFGYEILATLLTVVNPTTNVKDAMSGVKAAQRQLEAAKALGEADKASPLFLLTWRLDCPRCYCQW